MSLRPHLVHNCWDQSKILAWMDPFRFADVSKAQFTEMWEEAAKQLGEVRPKNCRCNYRVSADDAKALVEKSIAEWIVIDWRYSEEKKCFFPVEGPNLIWGGKQAQDLGLIRASYAAKTPRVQTIEKAHMERGFLDGNQDDLDRIEAWGDLQHQVWSELTVSYPDLWECPFRGRAVLPLIGFDQRTKSSTIMR